MTPSEMALATRLKRAKEIDRALAAHDRAMLDEAREPSTPKAVSAADALRALIENGRACMVPP